MKRKEREKGERCASDRACDGKNKKIFLFSILLQLSGDSSLESIFV